jgi:hypothetical protein
MAYRTSIPASECEDLTRPAVTSGRAYAMPAPRGVGLIKAPVIHRNGTKNPIHRT